MVWRAGGGGPMRRCIGSTGSLHSYSYPAPVPLETSLSSSSAQHSSSSNGTSPPSPHCPIPLRRNGTPPTSCFSNHSSMGPLSTSPGVSSTFTPPMNSPRELLGQPPEPFERTWEEDVVRIVCISDTHSRHDALLNRPGSLPPGDILIHAGDFSTTGTKPQVENFRDFLKSVPYAQKVIIAGNHDITLHEDFYHEAGEERFHKGRRDGPYFPAECRRILMNLEKEFGVTYIENNIAEVMGVKFWGTPWTPEYGGWAFNYEPEGEFCRDLYASVPEDVDVLITHGPPLGVGDLTHKRIRAGCSVLLREVRDRIKPRVHVFGHIHEGYGAYEDDLGLSYINASTSTLYYRPSNGPIVIDVPLDRSQPIRWVHPEPAEIIKLDLSADNSTLATIIPPSPSPTPSQEGSESSSSIKQHTPTIPTNIPSHLLLPSSLPRNTTSSTLEAVQEVLSTSYGLDIGGCGTSSESESSNSSTTAGTVFTPSSSLTSSSTFEAEIADRLSGFHQMVTSQSANALPYVAAIGSKGGVGSNLPFALSGGGGGSLPLLPMSPTMPVPFKMKITSSSSTEEEGGRESDEASTPPS